MGKMRTENAGTLRRVAIMSNRMTSDCHARLSGIRRYLESEAADWVPEFIVTPGLLSAAGVREVIRRGANGLIADISVGRDVLDAMRDYLGENVRLVSASDCAAERVRDYLVRRV